jgi:hypothetical protein
LCLDRSASSVLFCGDIPCRLDGRFLEDGVSTALSLLILQSPWYEVGPVVAQSSYNNLEGINFLGHICALGYKL